MSAMSSQITSLAIVYSSDYSGTDQRKHKSSASLAFVRGIHRVTGEFSAQMANNAENVSIWWRHHDIENHHIYTKRWRSFVAVFIYLWCMCFSACFILSYPYTEYSNIHVGAIGFFFFGKWLGGFYFATRHCPIESARYDGCWWFGVQLAPRHLQPPWRHRMTSASYQHQNHMKYLHDDVIKWKHFPRYWPLVREIHRSSVNSPHDVFFDLRLNEWLSKQSWGCWFETPLRPLWRHSNVIVKVNLYPSWSFK